MVWHPSRAEMFFRTVQESPNAYEFLRTLKDNPDTASEADWLEYKAGNPKIEGRMGDPEVKSKWTIALSAMANSGGGVLIWGVFAKCNPKTGVDEIIDIPLVSNAQQLKSQLQTLQGAANEPPVFGVEYFVALKPAGSGEGFVVCFIPESPYRPHRAELEKNGRYYIRAGASSSPATVSVLRSLFYPAVNSLMRFEVKVSEVSTGKMALKVSVTNIGTSTASDFSLLVQANPIKPELAAGPRWEARNRAEGEYEFEYSRPIHPGMELHAFTLYWSVPGNGVCDSSILPKLLSLELTAFATDREPQIARVTFNQFEISDQESKCVIGKSLRDVEKAAEGNLWPLS